MNVVSKVLHHDHCVLDFSFGGSSPAGPLCPMARASQTNLYLRTSPIIRISATEAVLIAGLQALVEISERVDESAAHGVENFG